MDAQTLFRDGVAAIRDYKDTAEGRRLLTESLRLNPNNDMAWLWMSRTFSDPDKRLKCIERALTINPANEQAQILRERLTASANEMPLPAKSKSPPPVSTTDQVRIQQYLDRAEKRLAAKDTEGAIEQWVRVLEMQPDHEEAMRNAVKYLAKLNFLEDAKELLWKAIDAGSTIPSIYLTAIDVAKREKDYGRLELLRDKLVELPTVDDQVITDVVDEYIRTEQIGKATAILEHALERHPDSQKLLIRMGDMKKENGYQREAMLYYDRAAKMGLKSKEGKEADKRLKDYVPVLTDHERSSIPLAWREAAGFGIVFLMMGWQDAGLNLMALGASRWAGVGLAMIGGYLVITATSSPQQKPLAAWLGGKVPERKTQQSNGAVLSWELLEDIRGGVLHEPTQLPILPPAARIVFGVVGGALLVVAFLLVFNTALALLANTVEPTFPFLEWE